MGVRVVGGSPFGSRPFLRIFSTVGLLSLLFFTGRWLFPPDGSDRGTSSVSRSLKSALSRSSSLTFSTYRYEAPQDLFVYPGYGRSVEAESFIAKVTILFHGKDPTYIRAIQTHQAHNRRFGYPLLILRHALVNGIWSKPAYLLAVLLEELRKPEGHRLKWLCWVDADTVITNPSIPLEVFLPPEEFPHLHLLATADPHGLSNGIFFIKVHPWAIELLSAILAYPILRPDERLEWRDQSAMSAILKEKKFGRSFATLPQRWFNSYQTDLDGSRSLPFQFVPGDLLVHFAGVPDRDERMKYYLERAEKHSPSWEVPLESTNLLDDIRGFWAEQHNALAEARSKLQEMKAQARETFDKTSKQLETQRSNLDREEVVHIERDMQLLKETLEEDRDDLEDLRSAHESLQNSRKPLEEAIAKSREEKHQEARALISKGEQKLLQPQNLGSGDDVDRNLRSQIGKLKSLLLDAPDDFGAIGQAMEELRQPLEKRDSHSDKS